MTIQTGAKVLGLAALVASGHLAASEIKTDSLSVKITMRLQSRIELHDATTSTPPASDFIIQSPAGIDRTLFLDTLGIPNNLRGSTVDFERELLANATGLSGTLLDMAFPQQPRSFDADLAGASTSDTQDADFYLRRGRLGFDAKYGENTKARFQVAADNIGRHGSTFGSGDRVNPQVRYAWVSHTIKTEGAKHTIKFGLDKPFFVAGDFDSSSRMLFPNNRPTVAFAGDRTLGLYYKGSVGAHTFGVSLQNARSDTRNWWISGRFETSLKPEWKMKRTESALGKEGFGHVLGLEAGVRTTSGAPDNTTDANNGITQFGIDYNVHYNNITANFDAVFRTLDQYNPIIINSFNPDDILMQQIQNGQLQSELDQMIVSAQAGYAIPLESGHVIEPALRLAYIDFDRPSNELATPFPTREGVNSGTQVDVGLNYYVKGHGNKFNLGVSHWEADKGPADKTVVRLQHQLNF